ncbi:MAG: CoA transferase [Myxococcota bacterium]
MLETLQGVRVLDLTRLIPGPLCTLVLRDLGADVVKIEEPAVGDYLRLLPGGLSGRFTALNRGKRSVALDLKSPAGRDALLRMAERSQVVVETFRPGVLDRLGVGFAALRAKNRSIVLCSITGYGQDGPLRDRAGHDADYIATAGVLDQSGHVGGPPELPGVQVGDCAGALWGVIGVLAALRGGQARHVDVSMTEAAMSFVIPMLGEVLAMGRAPARGTDRLTGGVACYGVYATADGHVAVGALEPKFWQAFCDVIGRHANVAADLVAPPERQDAIRAEVSAILAARTTAEWLRAFQGKEVCVEPVLPLEALENHPLHRARRNIFEVAGVRYPRTPLGPPSTPRPAPALGEHTAEVLREYGFRDDEILALA